MKDLKMLFRLCCLALISVSCSGGDSGSVTPSTPVLPTGVTLNSSSVSLKVGETYQLVETVKPSDAENKSVTWTSSNTNVATVKSGLVAAVSEGNATITVTTVANGKTATCSVSVQQDKVSVTGIVLNTSSITLTESESSSIKATISPSSATNKKILWSSSNGSIATVTATDNDGSATINALKEGTATITAISDDNASIKASCSVTVTKKTIKVTGIELNKTSVEITEGNESELIATVSPSDATNKKVDWESSDNTVATIDKTATEGVVKVKAIKEGSATITVKSNADPTIAASCNVTVNRVKVTGIELDKSSMTLIEGNRETLIASITPADAKIKTVTWSTDKESIVSITPSADTRTLSILALKEGSVTVTAKSDDNSSIVANCVVTVNKKVVPVTSINLDRSTLDVKIGKTGSVTATIVPDDATYKNVEWSIGDNSIASISPNGSTVMVTGLKEGTTTLTAKSKEYPTVTKTCQINVSAIEITGITLDKHSVSIEKGKSGTLTATISPSDATDKSLLWECNKDGYINIVQNGNSVNITALKSGKVVLTVSSKRTPSVKDNCEITIPVEHGGTEGTSEEDW